MSHQHTPAGHNGDSSHALIYITMSHQHALIGYNDESSTHRPDITMSHQHALTGHNDESLTRTDRTNESSARTGRKDILARNSKQNYRPPLRPVPVTVHVRPLREPLTVLTPLRHTGASEDGKVVPRITQRRRGSRGLSPRILNPGTRWARMVNFMLRPPYRCKTVLGV